MAQSQANKHMHDVTLYTPTPTDVLYNRTYNKGTAFTLEERDRLGLRGLLPPKVETLAEQAERALLQVREFAQPIDKYVYLASLKARNETLFYRLLIDNLFELMPVVYTPVVGVACLTFGLNYRSSEGMYFTPQDAGHFRRMLDNYPARDVRIIVVTDGSRILGLGDLGANGMGIPVGKLSLYVAAGGFHPATTLPVMFDVGTNNDALRASPVYLGSRHMRVADELYYKLFDEWMAAVYDKWPRVLVQFEDFETDRAFDLLSRFRNKYLSFNDDIQGTAAVVLAGIINAARMTKRSMRDLRCVFLGAGSAGVGVSDLIVEALSTREKVGTLDDARKQFWLVDSKGLVTADRGDKLQAHKLPYARKDNNGKQYKTLLEVIEMSKCNCLIGLSGQTGAFNETVLRKMAEINSDHDSGPIIFFLSNPTSKSECTFEEAIKYTDGRAVCGSGSPFNSVEYKGKTLHCGQANNSYIFPPLGFAASVGHCKAVTNHMLLASAYALADCVEKVPLNSAEVSIMPPLRRIREWSVRVAAAVLRAATADGVLGVPATEADGQPRDWISWIARKMYDARYVE